jgi:hypothetical protein
MKKYVLNTILLIIPIFTLVSLLVYSCQHEAIKKDEIKKVYFNSEIFPIIENNCTASNCHNGNGDVFPLTNYDEIANEVTKNNPSSSRLYQVITSSINTMPPNKPLTIQQRTLIYLWIEQGAENNAAPVKLDTAKTDTSKTDTTKIIPTKACFTRDIFPVIKSNCTVSGCHDGLGQNFSLTTYNNIKLHVVAGYPKNSNLYETLTGSGENRMPPSPRAKLDQAIIDSIYSWIKNGATNETCSEICDTVKCKFTTDIFPIIKLYCSSCHNPNLKNGNVDLSTYAQITAIANNGKLLGVLNKTGSYPLMPQSGKLSDCNISKISNWVKKGAKND